MISQEMSHISIIIMHNALKGGCWVQPSPAWFEWFLTHVHANTAPAGSRSVHAARYGPGDRTERQGLQAQQETVPAWSSHHWETGETAEDRAGTQAATETSGTRPFWLVLLEFSHETVLQIYVQSNVVNVTWFTNDKRHRLWRNRLFVYCICRNISTASCSMLKTSRNTIAPSPQRCRKWPKP